VDLTVKYNLYYLLDQTGDIHGDKVLYADSPYPDLASAKAQAAADGIAHYSVELLSDNGIDMTVVFIC
jgi:hypothetical protein